MPSKDFADLSRFPELEKDALYLALQNIKKKELLREVEKLRGSLLDAAQLFFEKYPEWQAFRSRALTILGRKGFERTVLETFEKPHIISRKEAL